MNFANRCKFVFCFEVSGQVNKTFTSVNYKCSYCFQTLQHAKNMTLVKVLLN